MIHIGFLLDVIGSPPPRVPVFLNATGLKAHTAVIAQSGSGKSFMLGRFLEEIVTKTRGRVIIFDPNSDFVKFHQINEGAWKDPKLYPWLDPADTLSEFAKRWGTVRPLVFTNRKEKALGAIKTQADVLPVSLSWGELPRSARGKHLGLDMASTPREMLALAHASNSLEDDCKKKKKGMDTPTLKLFIDYIKDIWFRASRKGVSLDADVTRISPDAALSVYARAAELEQIAIWDKTETAKSIAAQVNTFARGTASSRVTVVDLASISTVRGQLSVVSVALDSLWEGARQAWEDALSRDSQEDCRCPTYIVIDEAHNIAPEETPQGFGKYVADSLLQIAAEGRKFGLYLVLVTQRPSRVHAGLLGQCDNLCLLKVNSYRDLKLVEQQFGFVPEGWSQRALQFGVGDALLSGSFIERPVYVHIAPRRTVEGGRNLKDEFWLQDPIS
jgi:uncharacterized protein